MTRTLSTIASVREAVATARAAGHRIALVPTMGALHEGHLSLVRAAKAQAEIVIVSIFVNPLQFGPREDFSRYPRTLESDLELLSREDVPFVFAPSAEEMYPDGPATTAVEVAGIGSRLDGRTRTGHFRGVATVVAKLFNIVTPDVALFGQKDAAQVAVLRAMVRDLNFGLRLHVCPTVREADGLAMSSRNRYLSPAEREQALVLPRALVAAEHAARQGFQNPIGLCRLIEETMAEATAVQLEYVEVVDPDTLLPVTTLAEGALLAVAATVGSTRLIDNILLPARRSLEAAA
jgi:pantoate--beta-alanine ligase